jgi:Carboxypeptidase regulatory-like domain/TonB-dependent Receptor Plug Domain
MEAVMNVRAARRVAWCWLLAAGAAPPAFAQVFTGRIDAQVLDGNGAVMAGARVELAGPLARTTATDGLGQAHFLNLPVGNYHVTVTSAGFATYSAPDLPVAAGAAVPLRIVLALSDRTEQVEVRAEAPLIDTKKLSTGVSLSQDELQEIPTSRDPLSVVQNVPSVVTDRVNVGGSESGGRANYFAKGASNQDNTVNLDGVSLQDGGYEFALGRVDFDSFQEVQVTTGGATTSNPSPGVQVNYVLKHGENEPHGSARIYFDNDSLQGNNVTPEYAAVIGKDKGNRIDQYLDYGFELGGPIVKDKAWFWGSASRLDLKTKDLSGNPARTVNNSYAFKASVQATPNIRPSFTFFRSDGGPQALGLSPARPPETALVIAAPINLFKVESDFVIAKNLFLTARVARFTAHQDYTPAAGITPNVFLDEAGVWHNSFFYGQSSRPQTSGVADGSYFKGRHELKFGFSYRATPIDSSSAISSDGKKVWAVHLDSYAQDGAMLGFVKRDWKSVTDGRFASAYVGDTVSLNRATLNLALRYDHSTGSISETTVPGVPDEPLLPSVTAPAIKDALSYSVLSPRVGVSVALDEKRKTVVRASYALLSSLLKTRDVRALSGITYAGVYYLAVDANHNGTAERSEFQGPPIGFYGFDPSKPGSAATSVNRIDPNLKTPRTHEIVIGLDRELLGQVAVNASFTYRHYGDLTWKPYIGVRSTDYVKGADITGTLFGQPYSVPNYSLPPGKLPVGNGTELVNRDGYHQRYAGFELSAIKRLEHHWMGRLGFSTNSHKEFFDDPATSIGDPTPSPDSPGLDGGQVVFSVLKGSVGSGTAYIVQPTYQFIANGLYEGPWGLNLAANFLLRQGYAIPYYVHTVERVQGNFPPQKNVLIANAVDEFRLDPLAVLDARISKTVKLRAVKLSLDVDAFNLLNKPTVLARQPDQSLTGATGFNSIQEIISPRIVRFGLRLGF